jgi:hypothetical protein
MDVQHIKKTFPISSAVLHKLVERALKCGYQERFAQGALGHNSKAVHHA